ncbi:aldehyde dehydrogenase [Lacrimispora sp. NSJ-141]|uniref:Aldehyde dehydrogenase n=1 Tax=Lientehia hominis TaxID=2897778 RepID=A0AAP2RLD4_9FIRM|nr:aldehyde dehydrogenase [Lientehia hominis]
MEIQKIVEKQRDYFATGATRPVAFRLNALERLQEEIKRREPQIHAALKKDLNKSGFESYMTETGMTLAELSYLRKHLKSFCRPKMKLSPLAQFHSRSFTVSEPYGSALVMSPWNYPFMLCLEPLAGALAAGNCCVLKPSAYAPATSAAIRELIKAVFPPEYVAVVEGGRAENTALLEQRFDYIFFTGGVKVGKLVMEKASRNLTPVTLELGGKSPCIVEESADLKTAARRLAFGKYLNAGQTCVAPDYLLIQESVKEPFLTLLEKEIRSMFGERPLENPDYPKIVNEKHFNRLLGLMEGEKLLTGGEYRRETLQIAPAVLDEAAADAPVMKEEIFGPLLPVLTFREIGEAEKFVQVREKPLACYIFTKKREVEKRLLSSLSFGGGCVNDTIIHLATSRMGFGGVGASGMGSYHGKKSFETFSHEKSIVKKYNWIDMPIRYQPYTKKKEKLLRLFLK